MTSTLGALVDFWMFGRGSANPRATNSKQSETRGKREISSIILECSVFICDEGKTHLRKYLRRHVKQGKVLYILWPSFRNYAEDPFDAS